MQVVRYAAALAVLASAALTCSSAHAFFHLWRFTEFFSTADGNVQFIELFSSGPGETVASGATITSLSTGKVFTFPSDLSGNTQNKRLLIATAGFGSLTGAVTPDFTLPSTDFFNQNGDTLTLFQFGTIDSRAFPSVPTDGATSRNYPTNTLATNTPTNYSVATGSVNLPPPGLAGDFNGDSVVNGLDLAEWRADFGATGGSDADGDLDSDGADFLVWQRQLGQPTPGQAAGAVVPEPAAAGLACAGLLLVILGSASRPAVSATLRNTPAAWDGKPATAVGRMIKVEAF
ncbi:MAG: hypothetical protein H0T51_03215 [Pirellulales bacterium]|nr:hypothetical protein [Pirellulales bacterium]